VLSFEPASMLRRFASHAPLAFAAALGASLLRDRTLRQETRAYLRERLAGGRETPAAPELVQIFVEAAHQDRSVGSGLLQHVETYLRKRDVDCYYARTLATDNARALAFYERRGFRRVRELQFCGSRYVLVNKAVRGEPR
jgi:ribosomal protein S18 acetylase RimI-like enzyme